MKKARIILCLLLAMTMLFLSACGGGNDSKAQASSSKAQTTQSQGQKKSTSDNKTAADKTEQKDDKTEKTNETEDNNKAEENEEETQSKFELYDSDKDPTIKVDTPIEDEPQQQQQQQEQTQDKYHTDPVPEGMPEPVEPEDATITSTTYTCTISISCSTILDNMEDLDEEKVELVPEDGWLLEPIEVTFNEGESVFDVLQRVCRENKIHMESTFTPMYNSVYVEGIGNLYEFDCGRLSGWMYKVNEWFPNYGCSRYALQDGDVVCWEYTCDLGADVGNAYEEP